MAGMPPGAAPGMDDEGAEGAQPAAEEQGEPSGGGVCIEILCYPDGSYEVSSEPLQQEMDEHKQAGNAEPAGQKAATAGEALKLVLAEMRKVTPAGGDQFEAGYNG